MQVMVNPVDVRPRLMKDRHSPDEWYDLVDEYGRVHAAVATMHVGGSGMSMVLRVGNATLSFSVGDMGAEAALAHASVLLAGWNLDVDWGIVDETKQDGGNDGFQ